MNIGKMTKTEEIIPKNKIDAYYKYVSENWIWILPAEQIKVLQELKQNNIKPSHIYDIGSNFLHWYKPAKMMFPDSKFYLFEAYPPLEPLYKENKLNYNINVLSDEDGKKVKFYYHEIHVGGNSYFKINPKHSKEFSEDKYIELETITLDTLRQKKKLPYPSLIKMDVQGAELDILKGATDTLEIASYLLIELQHKELNLEAPMADQVIRYLEYNGWKLEKNKYSNNGLDADYLFSKL